MFQQHSAKSASRVAAGLFNVITGKFSAKTWQADEFLHTLNAFFERPAFAPLRQHIAYSLIYRPFNDLFEANEWTTKTADQRFRHLVQVAAQPILPHQIHNPHGGLMIQPCGWLHVGPFLDELAQVLSQQFAFRLIPTAFIYDSLDPETGIVTGEAAGTYDLIVFAEGVGSLSNPWFGYVPIQPLKGQVLEVDIPDFAPPFILSKKVFAICKAEGHFTVGSTYEKQFTHLEPTPEGIAEITGHLQAWLRAPFTVQSARASVRPTTPNRKPVLGPHPQFPRLWIQNGMGTKGVLQAPWAARLAAEILLGADKSLPAEVDVKRFQKLFPILKEC